jgi:hypothetical protein
MKEDIVLILCKLEKIYPPAFFNVMVHLAVHLPDEALLRGPVQYGWMYPIERRLGIFKHFIRNKARPKVSIVEAYTAYECMTQCSTYFSDIITRFTRPERNLDGESTSPMVTRFLVMVLTCWVLQNFITKIKTMTPWFGLF